MTNKTICRDDGRCEYAIQAGIEGLAQCQAGKCSMPQPAHLTIPGALEWDGDNGTHGVVGTHSADGESDFDDAKEACAEIERTGAPGDVIREMNDELVDLRVQLDESNVVRQLIKAWVDVHGRPVPWATAIEITAVATKMPEDEKAALLALNDEPTAQYTAVDMTTAAADGFRDGKESVADLLARTLDYFGEPGMPEDLLAEFKALLKPADEPAEPAVMNAPKPYAAMTEAEADEFLSSFGGGSGNKAKRRIAAIEKAKQKTCIECDQPYCHGVCVERGDQDYDRDQAAKGGDQ